MVMLCVIVLCVSFVIKFVSFECVLLESFRILIGVCIVFDVMLMMCLKLCVIILFIVVLMSLMGVNILVLIVVI